MSLSLRTRSNLILLLTFFRMKFSSSLMVLLVTLGFKLSQSQTAYKVIECTSDIEGKKITQKDWECHADGSCKCSVWFRDCFYCDPFGLERNGTNSYNSNRQAIVENNGCDCRYVCKYGVESNGMSPTIKQTKCVRNPF